MPARTRVDPITIVAMVCAAACAREGANASAAEAMHIVGEKTIAEAVAPVASSVLGAVEPTLIAPAAVRIGPAKGYWLLDTGRGTVFEFDSSGRYVRRVGRRGRGKGELTTPIALDVSPAGTAWVVDVGNAKVVGFRPDGTVREFGLGFEPGGVAAVSDNDIWIAGDLQHTVFVRLDGEGRKIGSVGVPEDTGSSAFRSNQGTAIRGTGRCAAIWAYVYRSIVECYDTTGHRVWRTKGPSTVEWPADAGSSRMNEGDVTAYNDIAGLGDTVYALFVGHSGLPSGKILQRFSAKDGRAAPALRLPAPAIHIALGPQRLAAVVSDSARHEHLHLYRSQQ